MSALSWCLIPLTVIAALWTAYNWGVVAGLKKAERIYKGED